MTHDKSIYWRAGMLAVWLLTLAAIGFAWREVSSARKASRARDALTDEKAHLVRAAATEKPRVVPAALTTAEHKGVALAASETANAEDGERMPESALLQWHAAEAEVSRRYARFFRRQGIREETARAAIERMARFDITTRELTGSAAARDAEMRARSKEERARFDEDLRAILGPEAFSALERFLQTEPHWRRASDLAARLHDTDVPLTPWQTERLAEIFVANATGADGNVRRMVGNWEAAFVQVRTVLSEPQIAMLETARQQEDARAQLNRMRAQAARQIQEERVAKQAESTAP